MHYQSRDLTEGVSDLQELGHQQFQVDCLNKSIQFKNNPK